MLNKRVEAELNRQITDEAYSSNLYLAMASWLDNAGYAGAAAFMYDHAEEERQHMLKIFHYLNEAGGHAKMGAMEVAPVEYDSFVSLFEEVMEHERSVTAGIHQIVDVAMQEKDYTTFSFIQWFVNEQLEEESLFGGILDKIRMVGGDKGRLFWVDKELAGMITQAPAAE